MDTTIKPSAVTEISPADSAAANVHFSNCLRHETDCWDVHHAMTTGKADFVLVDARGPDTYAAGHVSGAINIPHRKIVADYMNRWEPSTVFVVYCAGPHCNGAHRAAVRLSGLGRPVKLMIGGVTGWIDEGFTLEKSPAVAG